MVLKLSCLGFGLSDVKTICYCAVQLAFLYVKFATDDTSISLSLALYLLSFFNFLYGFEPFFHKSSRYFCYPVC